MPTLHLSPRHHERIQQHLFAGDDEGVAFGFANWDEHTATFQIHSIELIPPSGFAFQSGYHIELDHDVHAQIIKTAFDKQACVVEFHSHRSSWPAQFSFSDLKGFDEFVPHVRWRLASRPYAAVVLHKSSFDGLVWTDATPVQLAAIQAGRTRLDATGLTLKHLQESYD